MPFTITRDEYLQVNGVPLATTAWEATDLSDLRDVAVRGNDRLVPYKDGVQPLSRVRDALHCLIPIVVVGEKDYDDNDYADPTIGIDTNLDYLRENLFLTSLTGDGTVPVVWHMRSGAERTTDGMVLPPFNPEADDDRTYSIIMDLLIPSGTFTEGS